jgi:hypothetical protein
MNLNLKYAPVPDNAARFAEDIVRATREISGANLDYSPASLAVVDKTVEGFARDGCKIDDVKETLFGFGCYVGEVFVRAGHGFWRAPNTGREADVFGSPLVVELGPDKVCNPIGKVFKRLELGESESLPYFYSVFALGGAADNRVIAKRPWWKRHIGKT